jgi:Replication initiator protein, pSAM2
MLGYRGHFLTRSRRYSTTFRELRGARRSWSNVRRYGPAARLDRDGRLLPPDGVEAVASLMYEGMGYTTAGDAWLAWSMDQDAREQRRAARDDSAGTA